jgi:hypothetical protein
MALGDLAVVVLLVAIPVAVVAYLLMSWAGGRGAGPPPMASGGGVGDSIVRMTTTRQAVATQSFATQVGALSHIAVQAVGYLVARLRGSQRSPLRAERAGGETVHVVAVGGSYTLDVRLQMSQPPSYQGATVEVVPGGPVTLGVIVEGAGLEVSGGGRSVLVGQAAGRPATASFLLTPVAPGSTRLQVEFYQGNAWAQTLDMRLEARSPAERLVRAGWPSLAAGSPETVDEVECSNVLPAADKEPAPRHVHLRMRAATGAAAGRAYVAQVRAGGQPWHTLDVTLREHDLQEINQGLREALDLLRRTLGDRIDVTAEELGSPEVREVVDRLARRGNDAFLRIFPRETDQDRLLAALASVEHPDVELSTDAFFLAWELLYAPYDAATVDLGNFWGFRASIARVLTCARQRPAPALVLHGPPRVGLYVNPELPHAGADEAAYFRGLAAGGAIVLHDWLGDAGPGADAAPAVEQRRAFLAYCGAHASDVAHFACHAVARPYSRESYLALSSQLHVTLEDMAVDKLRLPDCPLVVLNACGTGVRDPLKTSDFVRSFMESSGRGVVASECDVPDLVASAFIREVYQRFLAGAPVARALFEARRHFLAERGNPLGLMYSAYVPLETRFVRAPASPAVGGAARPGAAAV